MITANPTQAKGSVDELLSYDSDNPQPLTSEQMGGIRVDVVMETSWEPNPDFTTNTNLGNCQIEEIQEDQASEMRVDSIAETEKGTETSSKLVGAHSTRELSPITPRRTGVNRGQLMNRANMSPTQNTIYAQPDPYGYAIYPSFPPLVGEIDPHPVTYFIHSDHYSI